MSHNIDLKAAKRKAYTTIFQDGILDIVLGLQLIAWGAAIALEKLYPLEDWWSAILWIPLALIFWAGKRYITMPRLGLVKFRSQTKTRLIILFTSISLALGVAFWFLVATGQISFQAWQRFPVFPIFWSILFVAIFSCGAQLTYLKRLYGYGFLYALTLPTRVALKYSLGEGLSLLSFFVPGIIILLVGLVLLLRFWRHYSLPAMPLEEA